MYWTLTKKKISGQIVVHRKENQTTLLANLSVLHEMWWMCLTILALSLDFNESQKLSNTAFEMSCMLNDYVIKYDYFLYTIFSLLAVYIYIYTASSFRKISFATKSLSITFFIFKNQHNHIWNWRIINFLCCFFSISFP